METPRPAGQLLILSFAIASFAVGGWACVARAWRDTPTRKTVARVAPWAGMAFALVTLVWHSFDRGSWLPL
jgi:hypothetical protein